jgi:hypothetical protein
LRDADEDALSLLDLLRSGSETNNCSPKTASDRIRKHTSVPSTT